MDDTYIFFSISIYGNRTVYPFEIVISHYAMCWQDQIKWTCSEYTS